MGGPVFAVLETSGDQLPRYCTKSRIIYHGSYVPKDGLSLGLSNMANPVTTHFVVTAKPRLPTPSDRLITENRKNSPLFLRTSARQGVASGKSSV
jgi:hypothetical protein